MSIRHRCAGIMHRLEAGGWWPDVAVAAVAFLGMTLILAFDAQAADGTGVGELLPSGLSTVWVSFIATAALGYAGAVLGRHWTLAWWSCMALALLLLANASVTVKVNGLGSIPAAVGYSIAVILLSERSRILEARRVGRATPDLPEPWKGSR